MYIYKVHVLHALLADSWADELKVYTSFMYPFKNKLNSIYGFLVSISLYGGEKMAEFHNPVLSL